jgi:hypothetical protein
MTWSSIFGFMFFSFLGYWLSIVVAGMGPPDSLSAGSVFPAEGCGLPPAVK